jgi:hypothetical protein
MWWADNPLMHRVREIYPDPPVVFVHDNNERGRMSTKTVNWSVRMERLIEGKEDVTEHEKVGMLRRAYNRAYAEMYAGARDALRETAWKENVRFVVYNAWPGSVMGRTSAINEDGEWKRYDGAMPEYYLNDWQIGRGKTDFSPWSPQTESLKVQASQEAVFAARPDYIFDSITWDGGLPERWESSVHHMATGRSGEGAVQRWDFDRYEGMVQYGLWAMRPRTMWDFRRGHADQDAYVKGSFQALVRAVDRVWSHGTLAEFWRHGTLVIRDDAPPESELPGKIKQKTLIDPLLKVDVNPPWNQWRPSWTIRARGAKPTRMKVFALAYVLGEAPERRWLLFGHAPLGSIAKPTVELPGFGPVRLPAVSRSGSFFLLDEKGGSLETLIPGGPLEIHVTVDKRFVEAGEPVTFRVWSPLAPEGGLRMVEGIEVPAIGPAPVEVRLTPQLPGANFLRVSAETQEGRRVSGDAHAFIGEGRGDKVIYEMRLNDAGEWSGPWAGIGEGRRELQRYRLVPNPGRAPDMVLLGGRFVDDPERGRVLELSVGTDGLLGIKNELTCDHEEGHANRTIAVSFKADDTQKRQVIFGEGHGSAGFNIYLDQGTLYAGGWGQGEKFGNWDGDWISADGITPDRWYDVALIFQDAGDKVEPDRMHLFVNGQKVGSAPGRKLPKHHFPPGLGYLFTSVLCHDGETTATTFTGRLADFRYANAAIAATERHQQ